jgi:hydrogenase expression/formation protein HypD
MGWQEYEPLAERYGVPIVVTGFEPVDLLEGILAAVRQLEAGRHAVEILLDDLFDRGLVGLPVGCSLG